MRGGCWNSSATDFTNPNVFDSALEYLATDFGELACSFVLQKAFHLLF